MTMRIGNLNINSMSINGKSVDSVWLGNDLVWGGAPTDIELDYFTLPTTTENFIITDGEFDFVPYIDDAPYTGSVIIPTIHGYVPDFMTISGDTTATDVGTYYITFTLPNGYVFKTTGNSSVTVSWKILTLYTLTINTGYYSVSGSYYNVTNVRVNEINYASGDTLYVNVPAGTTVFCQTGANSSQAYNQTYITYNGVEVSHGTGNTRAEYSFEVNSDVVIDGHASIYQYVYAYGYIEITTS